MQRAQRALHQTNKNRNKWNTSRRLSRTPYLFWYMNIREKKMCVDLWIALIAQIHSHTHSTKHISTISRYTELQMPDKSHAMRIRCSRVPRVTRSFCLFLAHRLHSTLGRFECCRFFIWMRLLLLLTWCVSVKYRKGAILFHVSLVFVFELSRFDSMMNIVW